MTKPQSCRTEYRLKLPLGTLTVRKDRDGQVDCALCLDNGHVLSTTAADSPRQLLLPCPDIEGAGELLRRARQLAVRSLKIIDAFRTSRRSIFIGFVIHGGEPAVELLESCPAIAMLVALYLQYHSSVDVEALCRKKRKDILSTCKFPSANWIVKLLGKIPLKYCTPYLLDDLKTILKRNREDDNKILQHLSQVSRFAIFVLLDRARASRVAPSFYQSAATHPDTDGDINAQYLLEEIVRLAEELEEEEIPKARSISDLQRVHDICSELYNNRHFLQYRHVRFADPPLAPLIPEKTGAKAAIHPLRNGMELYEEGNRMYHCIASYAFSIANRDDLYAYHVTTAEGEKATFLLQRSGVTWSINEIRGICNRDVSPQLRKLVDRWLDDHNTRLMELHNHMRKNNADDKSDPN